MITYLRYVPHNQLLAFLAKGWKISDELHGSNHGQWSVLMYWPFDGEPV